MSFLTSASKKAQDVRSFLREASSSNGIKYASEQNTKHFIFIPYVETQALGDDEGSVERELKAIQGSVHEWTGVDDKYKASVCLDGVVRKDDSGNVINDGSCPMCDRIADGWEVFNYRMKIAEDKHLNEEDMKKAKYAALDERKIKEPTYYLYMLIAQFRMKGSEPVINESTRLPEFDLKVMKMSVSRVTKLEKSIENSGMDFLGAEVIFDYPDTDDRRLLSSQCTTTALLPQMKNSVIGKYPAVVDEILKAVDKFEWEGIEKSFPEWKGMTTEEAKIIMDTQFRQYDEWKTAKLTNPNAQYLEYLAAPQGETVRPALTEGTGAATATANTDPNVAFGANGIDIDNI